MEAYETPFYPEQNLEKTYSVGCLINVNELDELKRNLKQYQEAQLEILQALGTAFAVFNQDMSLQFNNQAFAVLWKLDQAWLSAPQTYLTFLDYIRENRMMPEVPDYKAYKKDEVPVGAVLVSNDGEIIAKSYNTGEYGKSAIEHAELKVLQNSLIE